MRGMWRTGLGLSLGLLVGSASAEEVVWRPVGAPPAAVKPAVPPPARPAAAALGRPVAALGKPVAAGAGAPAPFDPLVRPVSFSAGAPAQPVFRGYSPDVPRPMPTGPALGSDQPPPQKLHPPKEVDPIDPPPPSVATVPTPHGSFQTIVPNYGGGPECCPDCGPDFCGVCGPEDCCGCDGCCCCNGCGRCGWCGFGNCCDGTRLYGRAEYLMWWMRGAGLPPLATTGPASTFGVLGEPGTAVLFGGGTANQGPFSGGRFTGGYWFTDNQLLGVEGRFFFLGSRTAHFGAASNSTGSPVISRPFIDALTGQEVVEQVAFPGEQAGGISADLRSRLWGAEANVRSNLFCGSWYKLGVLGGYRFLRFSESLGITEDFTDLGDVPTRHVLNDSFSTRNNFNGGQLGVTAEFRWRRFFLDTRATVALGATHQVVNIKGSELDTNLTTGQQAAFGSGLLAQPSNIGRYSRDTFSVVPEVGVNVGYQITPYWRAFVGYNFLFWSNVARPGAVIDRTVNITQQSGGQLVGPARPAFAFNDTNFWVQGLTFGMELKY